MPRLRHYPRLQPAPALAPDRREAGRSDPGLPLRAASDTVFHRRLPVDPPPGSATLNVFSVPSKVTWQNVTGTETRMTPGTRIDCRTDGSAELYRAPPCLR